MTSLGAVSAAGVSYVLETVNVPCSCDGLASAIEEREEERERRGDTVALSSAGNAADTRAASLLGTPPTARPTTAEHRRPLDDAPRAEAELRSPRHARRAQEADRVAESVVSATETDAGAVKDAYGRLDRADPRGTLLDVIA